MRWVSVDEKVVNAYMPDGSPAIVDQWVRTPMLRLTAQLSPKNKLMAFLERPMKFKGLEFTYGIEPTKASSHRDWRRAQYSNAGSKFTSTISGRILYEAGYTQIYERTGSGYQPRDGAFPSVKGYPRPANSTCHDGLAWIPGSLKSPILIITNGAPWQRAEVRPRAPIGRS